MPSLTTAPAFTPPPRSFLTNNNAAGGLGQVFGTDPNIQVPKVYEWNVGIQRNIGLGAVLEVRYVGNMSNDLIRTFDYNEVDVTNNGFFNDFGRAQSNLAAVDAYRALLASQGQTTAQINAAAPRSLLFNANVPGSQQLQVINHLARTPAA